jgi:ubiquinone/menaquinone biosynthesis C-methylase UbiE
MLSNQARVTREFDNWARKGDDALLERGHSRFTEVALQSWSLDATHRVLDVGCGNGWAVRRMIDMGADEGLGVDVSAEMIGRATPPGRYYQGSADHLPFPDAHVSHVLSVEALYYTDDPGTALAEWARVTRPGGRLLVLLNLFRESPTWRIWVPLFGFDVHVLGEAGWADLARRSGWSDVRTRRITDPRGPKPEAEFEPNDWEPTWADHVAEKQAGILAIEARRA